MKIPTVFACLLAAASGAAAFAQNAKEEPVVHYLGHASLCVSAGGKTIYIDPYLGSYDKACDVILVTHQHPDHNRLDLVKNRSANCAVITQKEALEGGTHRTFEFGFVTVEAVAAGGNSNHSEKNCVGYVLTFPNKKTLYVSGDTSTVPGMAELKKRNIDYAFFCCDGVYNMDAAEASKCALIVGAKHSLPYHTKPGKPFDLSTAQAFTAPGKIILQPGEDLVIE